MKRPKRGRPKKRVDGDSSVSSDDFVNIFGPLSLVPKPKGFGRRQKIPRMNTAKDLDMESLEAGMRLSRIQYVRETAAPTQPSGGASSSNTFLDANNDERYIVDKSLVVRKGDAKAAPRDSKPKDSAVAAMVSTPKVRAVDATKGTPKNEQVRRGRPKGKKLEVEQENPWEHELAVAQREGGYGGQLTLEAKIVALTLRHCHHLFVADGKLEEADQLGYKKIAKLVMKNNGDHPSYQAIEKLCKNAERNGGLFTTNMQRKQGSGRPSIYTEEQCNKIAANLMFQKLSRGYPFCQTFFKTFYENF